MRVKCKCGSAACWWYAPAGERNIQDRVFCDDCVSRCGDAIPGHPDEPMTDWYGDPVPCEWHKWPEPIPEHEREPNVIYLYNNHGTPGYWLACDDQGRVYPDCEYEWVGYHKRKWQWLKKKVWDREVVKQSDF